MDDNPLTPRELRRYSRQLGLPGIGIAGQKRIAAAKVLVIGAGGLGVPLIQYLAAAGTGTIGIADDDNVEWSNLQRQPIYRESDVGKKKVSRAAEFVKAQNSAIHVVAYDLRVDAGNVRSLIRDFDIIVDGTDNLATRYGVNDACVLEDKPMVYGSVFRYEGQVSVFNVRNRDGAYGPNFRDLFPQPPPPELVPDCAEAGVFGALPGIIGGIQAMEVIKWITGTGDLLSGRLLVFDGASMTSRTLTIPGRNARDMITSVTFSDPFCDVAEQANVGEKANDGESENLDPETLNDWMTSGKPFTLVDVREPYEREMVHIGGQHIPLHDIGSSGNPEIPRDHPVVFYCRSGVRSKKALLRFRESHPEMDKQHNLYHLTGGILKWIDRINPDLPKY